MGTLPGPFVMSAPEYTLTTARSRALGPAEDRDRALRGAGRAGWAGPVIVGALPFRRGSPPELYVAEALREGPGALAAVTDRTRPAPRCLGLLAEPDAAHYELMVEEAVGLIASTELDKVVLARTLLLDLAETLDLGWVLGRLADANPRAWNFAVTAADQGGDRTRTLVGASPELLVGRRGGRVLSHPLAGSVPRHPDPAVDGERARGLLDSAKDLGEHAFVVDAIGERLAPLCARLEVPREPTLMGTGAMWHLGTPITGTLRDPAPGSLELATALHPTPAVCGTPAPAAAAAIAALEPFDRGLYAGAVGWNDARGDGDWVIALRCAEVEGPRARLFAGAGVVADSLPAAERDETAAKFRTMLDALGVAEPGHAAPHRPRPLTPPGERP